ncbi:MAG: AraC family ligand binding domain-containing protein, partial [Bradyrhizobium sp.]
MNIAEKPIAAIIGRLTSTGDGIHMIANSYEKGVRLHTHMHREAQLVYAARGTMQVTTPKGRWLVPPDRAVWVPARLPHAIDVLADIEMRTLYFDLDWLAREERSNSLTAEFVVRVSPLLHQAILALFDDHTTAERTALLVKLAMLELHQAEDSATFI